MEQQELTTMTSKIGFILGYILFTTTLSIILFLLDKINTIKGIIIVIIITLTLTIIGRTLKKWLN